jgi:hypothetical protein
MSFHLSSSVHERYLFERIIRRFVFSRCFPREAAVFSVMCVVLMTFVIANFCTFVSCLISLTRVV